MSVSRYTDNVRWVVHCDPSTVESIKALAAARKFSMGHTLDLAVEYFTRKVSFDDAKPLHWDLPDDF